MSDKNSNPQTPGAQEPENAETVNNPLAQVSTPKLLKALQEVLEDYRGKVWYPKKALDTIKAYADINDDRIKLLVSITDFLARDMNAKAEKKEPPSLLDLLK
jgi:hypothetical protein